MIEDIDRVGERLREARGLAGLLAASRAGFGVLAAGCRAGERGGHELFAAFMFAGAAAAEGRIAMAGAVSLQDGEAEDDCGAPGEVPAGLDELADALARLARLLHERLASASRLAQSGDALICADAAIQAATVAELLVKGA